MQLPESAKIDIDGLEGPIAVFGAGGFIGANLLNMLLSRRGDVFGISRNPSANWRLKGLGISPEQLIVCDVCDVQCLQDTIRILKPRTVFNLTAYGAYAKQANCARIHQTNFNASIDIIEHLKPQGFTAYVQAGSSSEYGLNSAGPREDAELVPNSQYAVSKVATFYAMKYYGVVEKLPVSHLRLYSVFGPWEEPDRLMPTLIAHARGGTLPPLVDPNISRDFVWVLDACAAFIRTAVALNDTAVRGQAFNIGTGVKTTIRDLVEEIKKQFNITTKPVFGNRQGKSWDLTEWYGTIERAYTMLGWKATLKLKDGIAHTAAWQKDFGYDMLSTA